MLHKVKRQAALILESFLRNVGGRTGQMLRYFYYKSSLKSCGRNVRIDENVFIKSPWNVSIGSNVWISANTVIEAADDINRLKQMNRTFVERSSASLTDIHGEVVIGDNVCIGLNNIIQGSGGLVVGDKVTTSANVSVYTMSHHPYDPSDRSRITNSNAMCDGRDTVCIFSPIILEENVWLGLGVSVFSGRIGRNTFIKSGCSVNSDIGENIMWDNDHSGEQHKRFLIRE